MSTTPEQDQQQPTAPQTPTAQQPSHAQPTAAQPTAPMPTAPLPSRDAAAFPQQAPQSQAQQQHATQQPSSEPAFAPAPLAPRAPEAPAYGASEAPAYGTPEAPAYAGSETSAYAGASGAAFGAAAGQPGDDRSGGGHQPPVDPGHGAGVDQPQPKSRTGALLAGLAIGALLGGVVGGGVSAIVASNVVQPSATVQGGGTLTLSNADTATAISGVAAVATPSVVTLEVVGASASGSGSGVIYREDGYIITNAHVVTLDGSAGTDAQVRVKLSDGRILDGETVGVDPYADLAVVKVDAENLPAVQVADSSQLNVGDLTVAIGAPMNLANTVTSGVISSVDRGISVGSPLIPQDPSQEENGGEGDGGNGFGLPWDFEFGTPDQQQQQPQQQQQQTGGTVTLPVIQTDASINPGNSGGALLNGAGELIGINVAIASPTSSNGTASSAGLGFAIPSNLASRVADALIDGEQPSHGLLGASVGDSSQDTDDDANHAGGLIMEVNRGSAAEKAGLRAGDVITAVNGIPAADGTSVSALIRMHEGGSEVELDYTRDGQAAQTTATLDRLEW